MLKVKPDDYAYSIAIKAYGKLGLWQKALELKAQMGGSRRDLAIYNNLLATLSHNQQLGPALELKAEMELLGVELDHMSYSALLQNVCKVNYCRTTAAKTGTLNRESLRTICI